LLGRPPAAAGGGAALALLLRRSRHCDPLPSFPPCLAVVSGESSRHAPVQCCYYCA
jgi:hypothetical protein